MRIQVIPWISSRLSSSWPGPNDCPALDSAKLTFIDYSYAHGKDPAVSLAFVPNLANEADQVRSDNLYLET